MNRQRRVVSFASTLGALAITIAGCESSDTTKPPPAPPTFHVSAGGGSDSSSGSSSAPFKTIGRALSAATSGSIVRVGPGTYDAANGETFPLVVPAGVTLTGDTANRGAGGSPTLIRGAGPVPGPQAVHPRGGNAAQGDPIPVAAMVASSGATISGFTVSNGANLGFGIVVDETGVVLANNTFTEVYRGIQLEATGEALVRSCTFSTPLYGMLTMGTATIQDNAFTSNTYGIDVQGGTALILRNAFTMAGSFCIYTQIGSVTIRDNTFTSAGSSSASIVTGVSTTPLLRGNTFTLTTGPALRAQQSAAPDLGTTGDPGNNRFTTSSGADVHHLSSATITAIGNTWSQATPVCGVDITGTGIVYWSAVDFCPPPPP